MLGFHRFYLGKKISGFIWLFSAGLFMIGALYDLIYMNDVIASSEGKENEPSKNKKSQKKKEPTKTVKKSAPKQKAYTNSKAKVATGMSIRFILIFKSGKSQDMTEDINGVINQYDARKIIEAKYMNESVQRISWVNDKVLYS